MEPGFALSLSFEGISLLHRAADGWRSVGRVSLEVDDLEEALEDLRSRARQVAPGDLDCKIVIPNDQIRYLTIQTGVIDDDARREQVRDALQGATPYDVDDLAFALSVDGEQTHIAAVARDTLAEAEAFALKHGFQPICFVADSDTGPFSGEPNFGPASAAPPVPEVVRETETIEAVEEVAEPVLPDAPDADSEVEPEAEAEAEIEADGPDTDPPAPVPDEDAALPAPPPRIESVGFASRRKKSDGKGAAPSLAGARRDAVPPAKPGQPDESPEPVKASPPPPEVEDDAQPVDAEPASPTLTAAAPGLDVPKTSAKATARAAKAPARLLNRRKKSKKKPVAKPADTPIPIAPSPQQFASQDEAARMTIFGARSREPVGGKPRHLGLLLTVGLLIFMAVVAAWATLFLEDGVSRIFSPRTEVSQGDTEVAAVPESATPETPTPETPAPDVLTTGPDPLQSPGTTGDGEDIDIALQEPQTPEVPPDVEAVVEPAEDAESLTDTDAAVLEALREAPAAETASPQEDEARYAATGIWQRAPEEPETPEIVDLDNLYEVSIDHTDLAQDAVALPPVPTFETDLTLTVVPSPAAAGTAIELDERGLVRPTVEGTTNPDGIVVYLGRPPVVPPATPTRFEVEPEGESEALLDRLAGLRPQPRPSDLAEQTERAQLGGLTRAELGDVRPKARPRTAKQEAEVDETPTAQAIVVSRKPNARPRDIAKLVQKAERRSATPSEQVATAVVAPATVVPKIPSSASVARRATLDNAINLRKINLIGVYGTPTNRRALVRLPSGRYKKVKVGDRVDGGRVLAIGDSELRYQKGGRNTTLKIPNG